VQVSLLDEKPLSQGTAVAWDRPDSWCPSPVVGNHGHVGESLVAVVGILDGHPRAVGAAWPRDTSKCHNYIKTSIDTI